MPPIYTTVSYDPYAPVYASASSTPYADALVPPSHGYDASYGAATVPPHGRQFDPSGCAYDGSPVQPFGYQQLGSPQPAQHPLSTAVGRLAFASTLISLILVAEKALNAWRTQPSSKTLADNAHEALARTTDVFNTMEMQGTVKRQDRKQYNLLVERMSQLTREVFEFDNQANKKGKVDRSAWFFGSNRDKSEKLVKEANELRRVIHNSSEQAKLKKQIAEGPPRAALVLPPGSPLLLAPPVPPPFHAPPGPPPPWACAPPFVPFSSIPGYKPAPPIPPPPRRR